MKAEVCVREIRVLTQWSMFLTVTVKCTYRRVNRLNELRSYHSSTLVTACTSCLTETNPPFDNAVCFCVLCDSQNKQLLFLQIDLTAWSLQWWRGMFSVL